MKRNAQEETKQEPVEAHNEGQAVERAGTTQVTTTGATRKRDGESQAPDRQTQHSYRSLVEVWPCVEVGVGAGVGAGAGV